VHLFFSILQGKEGMTENLVSAVYKRVSLHYLIIYYSFLLSVAKTIVRNLQQKLVLSF
jgi:hypothetical protein